MASSRCPPKLVGCKMVDSYLFWWALRFAFSVGVSVVVVVVVSSFCCVALGLGVKGLSSAWIVCPLHLCGFSSGFWIGIAAWRCFDGLFRTEDSQACISREDVCSWRLESSWQVGLAGR